MSFCPLCMYVGANDLSYLNHIIIAHYNTSYGCGKCLKQAFVSSSTLHNHKKVCLRFDKKPTQGSDSKPSSSGGGYNSQDISSMRVIPKKHASKAPAADSWGSSTPTALQMTHATADVTGPITPSPTRTHRVTRKRRRDRKIKANLTSHTNTAAGVRPTSTPECNFTSACQYRCLTMCSCFSQFPYPCIFLNKLFLLQDLCVCYNIVT